MDISVVILPDLLWPQAVERWRAAEHIGFVRAWTYDHMSWRTLRDGPWLGTIPLLTGVATVTSALRIGTLVTSPNFRHPALLAKDAMSIDHISDGRLDLGIGAGAGGASWDARVLGGPDLSQGDRTSRFVEFVDALDVLLREPATSFAGRFYEVNDSRTFPGCVQRPRVPFTIAGTGPRALGVVAQQGAGWVTYGGLTTTHTHDEWYLAVRDQVDTLERVCNDAGRDPALVRRVALVSLEANWAHGTLAAWDDFVGLAEGLGFDEIAVHWPRPHDDALPGVAPEVFDVICDRVHSEF